MEDAFPEMDSAQEIDLKHSEIGDTVFFSCYL